MISGQVMYESTPKQCIKTTCNKLREQIDALRSIQRMNEYEDDDNMEMYHRVPSRELRSGPEPSRDKDLHKIYERGACGNRNCSRRSVRRPETSYDYRNYDRSAYRPTSFRERSLSNCSAHELSHKKHGMPFPVEVEDDYIELSTSSSRSGFEVIG